VPPVDAGQQVRQLRRRDRYRAIRRRRPNKSPPLQTFRKQAGPVAVVPNHLQQVTSATAEAEQMAAQRVLAKHFLNLQRQGGESSAHIRVARRQPHSHARRDRDHWRSSPRAIRSTASTSAPGRKTTRSPFGLTISIWPASTASVVGGVLGTTIAGTNVGPIEPSPAR